MHSLCRLVMSLRRLPFMASGPAHTTSDTVALVPFSHIISHFARQSHSKALPRRSLARRSHVRRYGHRVVTFETSPAVSAIYTLGHLPILAKVTYKRIRIQVIVSAERLSVLLTDDFAKDKDPT